MALVMAVIIGGVGVACVAWPVRAVTFCRWYPQEAEVDSGAAVRRYRHAAMDADILPVHGSSLLLGRARTRMDRNHQTVRLPH